MSFFLFVCWNYLLFALKAWRDSSKMARPFFILWCFFKTTSNNFPISSWLRCEILVLKISRFFQWCSATYTLLYKESRTWRHNNLCSCLCFSPEGISFLKPACLAFSIQLSEWSKSLQNLCLYDCKRQMHYRTYIVFMQGEESSSRNSDAILSLPSPLSKLRR